MGSRQIVLVSTAGFSVLNTGIFWREAKTKRLFSQCSSYSLWPGLGSQIKKLAQGRLIAIHVLTLLAGVKHRPNHTSDVNGGDISPICAPKLNRKFWTNSVLFHYYLLNLGERGAAIY
jgi:hypothetical protein